MRSFEEVFQTTSLVRRCGWVMEYEETKELRKYVRANLQDLAELEEWDAYCELVEQAGTKWRAYREQVAQAESAQPWNLEETDLGKKTLAEIEADTLLFIERLELHRQKLEEIVFERVSSGRAVHLVNRCRQCQRVIRTVAAKQCFWCGADWH